MKTFNQFNEDASSSASSAISGSGSFKGGSGVRNISYDSSFKKRPKTGIGAALKGAGGVLKDNLKTTQGNPKTDGPGKQTYRKRQPYRS